GALRAALRLVPWYLEAARNPAITDVEHGFLGRGLLYVFPLVRGVLYWFRYASLAVPDKMGRLDFPDWEYGAALGTAGTEVVRFVLPLTLLVPLLANRWLWRRARRWWKERFPEDGSDSRWLVGHVAACSAAALLVFALAPTTLMWWQGVLLFHAAVLP